MRSWNTSTLRKISYYMMIFLLMMQHANAQSQVIGSFPGMQGGFENTSPTVLASTSVTSGTQLPNWSYAVSSNNVITLNTTIVRSGLKSLDWSATNTSALLFTPTATSTAVLSSSSYVIQFYYWKNNSSSARALNAQITADASANLGTAVSTGLLGTSSALSASWVKSTTIVSTGAGVASPRYGFAQLKPTGGSFNNLLIDDYCIYPGTAADTISPTAATSPTATSTSNTTVDVSWSGLLKAGDGGGYVIVRSTSATPVTINNNGIYGVGLSTATGGGTVVAIVDGVSGLNTFSDAGLLSGTTYYYSIFAADKAFNYAPAATCSVLASTNPLITTSVSSLTGFTQYGVPSSAQTYTVSGLRLTGSTVDLTASANFQLSLNNTSWSSTLSLPVSGGGITGQPLTIYVRLNAATTGTYTGTITHVSNGASNVIVNLNGTNDANTRILTSVTSMSGFVQTGATPSSSQSYTVSGFAISDASITLSVSAGFQISTDNTTWVTTINLPTSFGLLTGQPFTVYVRQNDPASGTHTGNITHTCTGVAGVLVNLNGTTYTSPALSVNPSTLSFGNVTVGQSSAVQSFTLSGILLSPSTGTLTLTAPSGYTISTSSGSGFSGSITVNYTGSTLSNQIIYVQFSPLNDVAYSGNIVITGGTAPSVSVGCTGTGTNYSIGDYGSVATGLWSSLATWKQWDGTGFNQTPTVVPAATNNVWINSGHTVTINPGTRGNCPCKNLFVAGTLIADTYTKDDKYVAIYGSLLKMLPGGFIGSSTNTTGDLSNGISIRSFNPNLLIAGSGSGIYLSRLVPALLNGNITVDHNMTLTYHGTSNQGGHTVACFPEVANSTITINAGKTMTFAPWASLGTTETTSTLHPARSFTVNVSGTISMLNSPAPNAANETNNTYNYRNSFIYGGTSGAGNVFSLNIYNGGSVNTAEIYPNGNDGAATQPAYWLYNCGNPIGNMSVINVNAGGTLSVYKMADFRKPTQFVTGGGTFNLTGTGKIRMGAEAGISAAGATGQIQTGFRNFSGTGVYAYEGVNAQITGTGLPTVVSGLIVNNAANVTVSGSFSATDSLNFSAGKLILGDQNVTTSLLRNGSASSYVVTNGSGYIKLLNVNATEKFFPVGTSVTSYNPAWITNTGTSDHISVKVEPYALGSAVAWPAGVPRNFRSIRTGLWNSPSTWEAESYRVGKSVSRVWTLTEDVQGGSNLSVRFQWNTADELPGFNRLLSSVVRFNGSVIDYPVAPIPYTAASGSNPYTQSGSGINSTVLQFGVVSDTSTSVLSGPTTNAFPNSAISHVQVNQGHTVTANTGSITTCGNLQIDGTLTLSATSGDNLYVAGNWNRTATGVFNHTDRTVFMNGSGNTSVSATNGEKYSRLIIQKAAAGNTVTINDSISVIRELNVESGILTLTSKNVTLLSDSSCTASFGPLNTGGSLNYSGAGRFIVERYINTGVGGSKHPKSWQLVCAPATGQTIKESWMENGVANSNPYPGYGTQIVGPAGVSGGFDTTTATPSMKVYSPNDSTYIGVANTGLPINNSQGYMFFVRGDRSVTTYNAPAKPTILRCKGNLLTGNVAGPPIPANKFQSVANPYASPVNYSNISKSGLSPFIYVYDPTLSSYYGLGGFQTIELSNGNATPGGTNLYSTSGDYRAIQSGQAFFVRSGDLGGAISFKESDKIAGYRLYTKTAPLEPEQFSTGQIQANLYLKVDERCYLLDGNKVMYDKNYSNDVDINDAVKMLNEKDNFGIIRKGSNLAIEARAGWASVDTVCYHFSPSQKGKFVLKIIPNNLNDKYLYFNDKYTKCKILIEAKLNHEFIYDFVVNEDLFSSASDRFSLLIASLPPGSEQSEEILSIYPNPVVGNTITFEWPDALKSDCSYEISGVNGQLMTSGMLRNNSNSRKSGIALSGTTAKGIFILTLKDETGKKWSSSFVKK